MPSGTWATSLSSTHSNTDHVGKALTHVKICLSTDNSERRFNNSTEKLKSGIKLNNWTQLNWTKQNWNAVQPCSMRSTCCQNANPTATLSGPLAGAGLGCFTYWHHHFAKRRQTVKQNNCCQIYYTQRRALKAQAGENSEETQEKEEGRRRKRRRKGKYLLDGKKLSCQYFYGAGQKQFQHINKFLTIFL